MPWDTDHHHCPQASAKQRSQEQGLPCSLFLGPTLNVNQNQKWKVSDGNLPTSWWPLWQFEWALPWLHIFTWSVPCWWTVKEGLGGVVLEEVCHWKQHSPSLVLSLSMKGTNTVSSLLPDCKCNVTAASCPYFCNLPHLNGLCPWAVSQRKSCPKLFLSATGVSAETLFLPHVGRMSNEVLLNSWKEIHSWYEGHFCCINTHLSSLTVREREFWNRKSERRQGGKPVTLSVFVWCQRLAHGELSGSLSTLLPPSIAHIMLGTGV